jgi:hypothetical protein
VLTITFSPDVTAVMVTMSPVASASRTSGSTASTAFTSRLNTCEALAP